MTTIDGWTAPGFEGVRDAFAANFAEGSEVGAAFAAYHRGRARGRPLGRRRRRRDRAAVGRGHDRRRLLEHQGRDGDVRAHARGRRPARSRRAGRRVLARVRAGRQGGDHRLGPAVAPGRARLGRRRAHARAGARVGPARRRARAPGAVVGAALGPRLPRRHVRQPRRRGRAAGRRPLARHLLRRGGRRAARARLLHRPPRGARAARRDARRQPRALGGGDGALGGPDMDPRHAGGARGAGRPDVDARARAERQRRAGARWATSRAGRQRVQQPCGPRRGDPRRQRHHRRAVARPHVRGLHRRGRRRAAPHRGADARCRDAAHRRAEHRDPEPGPAVRARLLRAVVADQPRWSGVVRSRRRGRLARLGRPRRRARVRVRDEPHGPRSRRRRAQLLAGQRLLRRPRLTGRADGDARRRAHAQRVAADEPAEVRVGRPAANVGPHPLPRPGEVPGAESVADVQALRSVRKDLKLNPIIEGYKIACSGRFTKKEIASYDVFKYRNIPTSTGTKHIDFISVPFILKYSLCNFKIWLCLNYSKFSKKEKNKYLYYGIFSEKVKNLLEYDERKYISVNNYIFLNKKILYKKRRNQKFHNKKLIFKYNLKLFKFNKIVLKSLDLYQFSFFKNIKKFRIKKIKYSKKLRIKKKVKKNVLKILYLKRRININKFKKIIKKNIFKSEKKILKKRNSKKIFKLMREYMIERYLEDLKK